ncbi:hypothetical protein T09_944 [Trichinella sp. T9]|nr:hypothetical protein T09_944 [Trichinella sp. T9]
MIIFILRTTLFICTSGWVPAKTASSGMLLVNPFVSSIGGESQENGFVSGTKINRYKYEKTPIDNIFVSNEERMTSLTAGTAITFLYREEMENGCVSLPRMLASITFALNERRNQNGNSGSKLLRTVDYLSCDRTCNKLNVADVSQGQDPQHLIFQFLWHNHMDEPHGARCFSIF